MPTKDMRTTLGENVKRLRVLRGLSQTQVADRTKTIDQTTVGRIERGIIGTSVDVLPSLAKALEASVSELLVEQGAPSATRLTADEPSATYEANTTQPELIRELIAGVLGPLGLQLLGEIEIDDAGVRVAAQWRKSPQERRRGMHVAPSPEPLPEIDFPGKIPERKVSPRKAHANKPARKGKAA